jgi:SMI1/KNR4 family protein SUKH-1
MHACERTLGFDLDEDHKEFLLHADGWDAFLQDTDLFGTSDFLGSRRCRAAQGILDAYERPALEQIHIPRQVLYPIGGPRQDDDRALFVMVKPSFPSKSRVLWLTGYGVERFPSFSEFFVTMIAENYDEMEKLQEE